MKIEANIPIQNGLKTVERQFEKNGFWEITRLWNLKKEQGFRVRELCDRSQAEELLAAERAEKTEIENAWLEALVSISELKADNAAKDARIKELEQALETEKTLSRGDWACQREVDQMSIKVEALEAKLAAAHKALEFYAKHASGCRKIGADGDKFRASLDADGGATARAVLGGRPS